MKCKHILRQTSHYGGPIVRVPCSKDAATEDGYCHKHHKQHLLKNTPFGERECHRPATEEDIQSGRTVKLKTQTGNNHTAYRYNGALKQMVSFNTGKPVTFPPDYNLYCVKK